MGSFFSIGDWSEDVASTVVIAPLTAMVGLVPAPAIDDADSEAAVGYCRLPDCEEAVSTSSRYSCRLDAGAQSREQALATLRQEHAIGVVVAVRGEVIWADIFSDTELLTRYWTKLVRS